MTGRAYYSDSIDGFLRRNDAEILGVLIQSSPHAVEPAQRDAWIEQFKILRTTLQPYRDEGRVLFEFSVPRLGKRIDAVLVLRHLLFVLEFKVGETSFTTSATDQVWDYGLDLKNFHETTHHITVVPILVATCAKTLPRHFIASRHGDKLLQPVYATPDSLPTIVADALVELKGQPIPLEAWEVGGYHPTPTIVEAAMALYGGHSVVDISRSDAGATNLLRSSKALTEIIRSAQANSEKTVCFVTGVPGAGKTLVGLDIATKHFDKNSKLYSVFLSGNGPLVAVLREALARDKVRRERESGKRIRKGEVLDEVKLFIQNVHNFRDDCLVDQKRPPIEHVALFDEAQRAWDLDMTADFMRRKRGISGFDKSEPAFLISCMDRHNDWAVVVCLVGGGQEINRGEAGIGEWINALNKSFPKWHVQISPHLHESEYGAGLIIKALVDRPNVTFNPDLHLSVSMRSFRAEHVSALVKAVLDMEREGAADVLRKVISRYPIVLTRDLKLAKLGFPQYSGHFR